MVAEFITGREIIFGVKKASTWRTAVACGANDGVLVLSESLGAKAPEYIMDESLGLADIKCEDKVSEKQEGSFEANLRYEGLDLLFALALGTAGTPTQIEGTAYYNTYEPADTIADLFSTIAVKKSGTTNNIWEIPSAMITGFTISGAINEYIKVVFNTKGNKIYNQSVINTNASMENVTYPSGCNIAKFNANTKFRMNARTGDALDDDDKVYPSSFELTYNRPMKDNFEAGYIDASQPTQDGFAETSIKIVFDKYNTDTFMDAIESETDQKMDILFQGDLIEGTTYYQNKVDIPKIIWKSGDAPVGGSGTIPFTAEGSLRAVDSAPTGMTTLDPLSMYVQNTRTTDPLA